MTLTRRQFTLGIAASIATLTLSGCANVSLPSLPSIPWPSGETPAAPAAAPAAAIPVRRAGQHPALLDAFGGEYADPRLHSYVTDIGKRLAAHVERPYVYRFTVLDSPTVNAFALADGNVFVTRGLLALASSEAEVAGVLAHELGHINAGHSDERFVAQAGAVVPERTRPPMFRDLPSDVFDAGTDSSRRLATLVRQPWSQAAESRADALGAGYMSQAGYAPEAMATFAAVLRQQGSLEALGLGAAPGSVDARHMMSTHPRTAISVRGAIDRAGIKRGNASDQSPSAYLDRINGLPFGSVPDDGVIQGNRFTHTGYRYQFDAPPGFSLRTANGKVLATDGSGRSVALDIDSNRGAVDVRDYLVSHWGTDVGLRKIARTKVNGAEAVTATTVVRDRNSRPVEVRLVAITRDSQSVYRLMFFSPPSDSYDWEVLSVRSTYSLKSVSAGAAATLKPLRLSIEPAGSRTVADLSATLPYGARNGDWYRLLNRIAPGAEPRPDQRIKVFAP